MVKVEIDSGASDAMNTSSKTEEEMIGSGPLKSIIGFSWKKNKKVKKLKGEMKLIA